MIRVLIFLGLTSISFLPVFSQTTILEGTVDGLDLLQSVGGKSPRGNMMSGPEYEGVVGTSLFREEFQPGTILLSSGEEVNASINYDVYYHELVVELTARTIALTTQKVKSFEMQGPNAEKSLFCRPSEMEGADEIDLEPGEFLRVLYKGDISLVAQYRKNFHPANYNGTYGDSRPYDKYNDLPTRYYVIRKGLPVERVKLRAGSLKSLFPDRKNEIKELVKRENLEVYTEPGATRVIEWLDQN